MSRQLAISFSMMAVVVCCLKSTFGEITAYSLVTRDGRRLVSHLEGTNTVYELVATNALPKGLPPVREWTIYGIKSAHTDLGLHRSNYVQRKGTVRRLELAKGLFDADGRDDDDPAAFRYVQEGWWGWYNFIADRGTERTRCDFADLLKRGRLDIGLSLCGNTTHVFGYEELNRSLYPLRDLRMTWGVGGRTSQMVDNPGISSAVIDPYVDAGLANLTFWSNAWAPKEWSGDSRWGDNRMRFEEGTDHPCVFWWESPSGKRLLVWSGSHYGGGWKFGLATAFIDKLSHPRPEKVNLPPADWRPDWAEFEQTTAKTLAALEQAVPYDVWLFPDYHDDELPSTRLSDAFAAWNAKWATPTFRTVGRLDEPFARLREKFADSIPVVRGDLTCAWDRALPAAAELLADKLAADRALPRAEAHATLAAVLEGQPYPKDDLTHAYEALVLNDDHSYGFSGYSGRRCYDTWAQHRDWIETAGRTAARFVGEGECRGEGTCARENRWYRLQVNEQGEITSIFDKELGRELVDGVANRLLYTRDCYRTWSDPSTLGGRVTQKVWLDPNEKRIVIENEIADAADLWNTNRFARYGHYAFKFAVPSPRFYSQLNGPVIDAHDGVTPHVSDAYSCLRDWCAVENGEFGVALVQPDTFVVEYGELHTTNAYRRLGRPAKGHVYTLAFTDGLQYQHSQPPSFRFRFVLTSYAGSWRDAHIPAFAARQVGALAADRTVAARLSSDAVNVELVALKVAEDGQGLVARFRETEGRETEATLRQSLVADGQFVRATVLEEPLATDALVADHLHLKPFETATVRLSGTLPEIQLAAGELWTGLLTRPRAFAGGKNGPTYLLWNADLTPDFDHYELFRDGELIAAVTNIVDEGIVYRNARYEDLPATPGAHRYEIRAVYLNGLKGPLVPALAAQAPCSAEEGFVSLFDGRTLEGWIQHGSGGPFFVEDGEIVARTLDDASGAYLCTTREYENFIFRGEYRFEALGNSGIQFRSQIITNKAGRTSCGGYQCEMTPDGQNTTRIFDQSRTGFRFTKSRAKIWFDCNTPYSRIMAARQSFFDVGSNAWQQVEIRCEGPHIRTWLNGLPVVDILDATELKGVFGLQLHPGAVGGVRWRNLRVKELPPNSSWRPFDPKNPGSHRNCAIRWNASRMNRPSAAWFEKAANRIEAGFDEEMLWTVPYTNGINVCESIYWEDRAVHRVNMIEFFDLLHPQHEGKKPLELRMWGRGVGEMSDFEIIDF